MSFKTREEVLDRLSQIARREIDHRHICGLGYMLAMNFELVGHTPTMNDNLLVDNVCHLLFEYTTLTTEEVSQVREAASQFYQWRLAITNGTICNTFPIYGEAVGTSEVLVHFNDFVDPMTLNGIYQLINRDEEFMTSLLEVVKTERAIIQSQEV